jgi:hypothetical protein
MKMQIIKTITILFAACLFCSILHAQQDDTLYIRKGENENIRFARFAKSADIKMSNDTIFLKSIIINKK